MNKASVFYRLPGTNQIIKREGIISDSELAVDPNQIAGDVFYLSSFNNGNKAYTCYLQDSITQFEIIAYHSNSENKYDSKDLYVQKVNHVIHEMNVSSAMSKVVLARCKKIPITQKFDINTCLLALCNAYPNAFVYAISSKITGTWMAASPELLINFTSPFIKTTALAGTMLANEMEDWGSKEIDEQHQVELFIEGIISSYQLELMEKTGPQNLIAGHLKHIQTNYKIAANFSQIAPFLNSLNPTPAVAGLPVSKALAYLENHENLDRKFYAGFVGIKQANTLSLFVNLRCMEVFKSHLNLYAGCGITQHSNAESEWMETENKLKTLTNIVIK